MQYASAPGIDRENSSLFAALRTLWLGMLAVSAVQVRMAFDSPWDAAKSHGGSTPHQ